MVMDDEQRVSDDDDNEHEGRESALLLRESCTRYGGEERPTVIGAAGRVYISIDYVITWLIKLKLHFQVLS